MIGHPTISVGTLPSSLVHPREVFKSAIKASAAGVFLVHNHPSGRLEPSAEERRVTERLLRADRHIGIEVLDHVIIGAYGYLSLKERDLLFLRLCYGWPEEKEISNVGYERVLGAVVS